MIKPELRATRTREQILDAARLVLVRDGYERITTRRIAEEAGVNIATLHYYFGTKEDLLTQTILYAQKWMHERLLASVAGATTFDEMMRRVFAAMWEVVRDQPGVLRFDLAVRGFRDETARRQAQEMFRNNLLMAEHMVACQLASSGALLPEGVTVTQIAHYFVSAVDGLLLNYCITRDEAATLAGLDLIREHALLLLGVGDIPAYPSHPARKQSHDER